MMNCRIVLSGYVKYRRVFDAKLLFGECTKSRSLSLSHNELENECSTKQFGLVNLKPSRKVTLRSSQLLSCSNYNSLIQKRNYSAQVLRPYVDPDWSYVFGRSNESLIYSTVARQFDKHVEERPDDVVFISHYEDKLVTFRELNKDVNKLAKALVKKFNIKKGDHVGVYAYNSYNWVVVQYACSKVGAVLCPINPSNKADELLHILVSSQIKCLFMPGPNSVQAELNDHLDVLQSDTILEHSDDLKLRNVILLDSENEYRISTYSNYKPTGDKLEINFKLPDCNLHNWSSTENDGLVFKTIQEVEEAGLSENEACILNSDSISPDDVFAVYFTSGTTGKPKGACVSHFTVINNCSICHIRLRNGRPRNFKVIVATTLPLFHIFAGVLNALGPVVSNTTVVLTSYKYNIAEFVEAIYKHQANYITVTPTMLIDMLTHIEVNKLTDLPLKVIQPGGAALSPEIAQRTFKILPNLEELRTGYGSTENGSVSTFQTIHEPAETRAFTVGPPVDFTAVRIVKPKTNVVVPHGVKGEIQTKGHNTLIEYLGRPDATAEVLTPNQWYKTGDIGFMHPHGSIQVCGRLKHMIIKGGENIYPEEVEQLIHKLEFVEDAHVVGVPDRRFGEQVCAWVKLKPGYKEVKDISEKVSDKEVHPEDIISYCKKNITYFKVPKYLLFVDSFPLTPTKKIKNHVMVEESIKLLNLQDEIPKI